MENHELINRLDAIYNNPELENKDKIEQIYKFYLEEVLEELKSSHKTHVNLKL